MVTFAAKFSLCVRGINKCSIVFQFSDFTRIVFDFHASNSIFLDIPYDARAPSLLERYVRRAAVLSALYSGLISARLQAFLFTLIRDIPVLNRAIVSARSLSHAICCYFTNPRIRVLLPPRSSRVNDCQSSLPPQPTPSPRAFPMLSRNRSVPYGTEVFSH